MKKLFMLNLCVFFIFAFSSCSNNVPKEPVTNFSATMQVQSENINLTGEFSNTYQGVMTFSITSPNTIKGLKYIYMDNKLEVSLENIKCDTTWDYLPKVNYLNMLYNCLYQFSKEENLNPKEINEFENWYSINANDTQYDIYTNTQTGFISKIETENLKINFSSQKQFTE